MRTAFDFSPLYRSTVGFDRLFDLLDQAHRLEAVPNWPPSNIERVAEAAGVPVPERKIVVANGKAHSLSVASTAPSLGSLSGTSARQPC
jgi:hypothetical protein